MNSFWRRHFFAFLLVLPCLLFLSFFVLYPALQSIYLSFHDIDPFSKAVFPVGWDHYRELVQSTEYWQSFKVSLLFTLLTVPVSIVASLGIAVMLDARPFVQGFFRTIFLLPVGISPAMAAMLWVFLYNPTAGYLNYFLSLFGLNGPSWITDPSWALFAVAIATVWKEIGFNIIFFLAALAAVPSELKEAAVIDGAGPWRRFRHVTLPMISPTVFFVATVSVIHAFESFGQIHILTKGGPADATNVLVYKLYRDAFENFRTGFASAQAVLLFIMILALTVFQFRVARSRVHYR